MNNAWEVVALNKLYSSKGGFEELDSIFFADRIDFIQAKNEIIALYEKLNAVNGAELKKNLNQQDLFSSLSREKLQKIEEIVINHPIFQTQKSDLEIILEVCNLLSKKEIADCMRALFEVLDQVKSKTCRFFISEDFAYLDILVFSALRRCRAWKKVIKTAKETVPHLFHWHEWIKTEHKKGLFQEKIVVVRSDVKIDDFSKRDYFEAVKTNNISEIQKFLDSSITIECVDPEDKKKTACHIACEIGNLELLKFLKEKYNCSLEARDCEEMTPLFYALESKNIQVIEYLINQGVNLEHNDFVRQTPFYYACYVSSVEAVRFLYEKGCDIDSLYSSKRSPLNKAADMGRKDIVEFLVSCCPEIKINETGKRGRTALQMAVWAKPERIGRPDAKDYPEIAEILLENGAQVNQKDHEGYTALITAAATGAVKSIPILIKFGAIVDCVNNLNETPIYKASERGHLEVCKLLLEEYKADLFLKSQVANLDCIEISIVNQRYHITKYFLEKVGDKGGDYFNKIIRMILSSYEKRNEILSLIECCHCCNFDLETLEKLIELKDESLLEKMANQENTKLLIETCLKIRWINGLKILLRQNNEISLYEWDIFQINLDLNDEDLRYILTNLNIDIFKTDSETQETILHTLVKKKNTLVLSNICTFLRNYYSVDLANFLNAKSNDSYSAIDLAILNKDYVACQILEQVISEKLQTSITIPSYSIEISEQSNLSHKQKEKLIKCENEPLLSLVSEQEWETLSLQTEDFRTMISQRNIVLVETEQHLEQIASKIFEKFSLIGVDMECYHDQKNGTTFVCLMQISCIEEDYLIDCLKLHLLINQYLQPVFEAEKILKVFHGCDSDLKWLKSNFDIDVVNLFDTSRAHMILNNDNLSLGLSALTQQLLGYELDKTYQKADWRVRPLPKVMMEYGRNDSCVLLFLWFMLSQELKKNPDLESQMNLKMARKCWKTIEESSQSSTIKVKFSN